MQLDQHIQHAAHLIKQARQVVALTGAGISTPSGIPDFRSPQSGLWDQVDPAEVASIFSFRQHPERFFAWVRPLAALIDQAQPNPAHYALAALEQQGKLQAVITQNIDNLHSQAGSKTVYELHGNLHQATCIRCYAQEDGRPLLAKFIQDGQIPYHSCGGVLKPNIILFGEQLPLQTYALADAAMKAADLMLVIGSSLEVAPVSEMPALAHERGAKLIIINFQPTHADPLAELVISADAAQVLPAIVDLIN
jgi:NAD-dependent deacetylase